MSDERLSELSEGVWVASAPARIVGMPLTTTMTVLRLGDGSLLLFSPIHPDRELRSEVDALGEVSHLYAPNLFHHLWISDWVREYPEARVHAPARLAKKRPDLRIDRAHGTESDPALLASVTEHVVRGCRLEESVLVHQPSGTLLVADLVHNVGRPEHAWARFYTRAMGFYDRVALSRVLRWTAFSDRRAARRSLDEVLSLEFERVIVGHGAPIEQGGKQALRAAFEWLQPAHP